MTLYNGRDGMRKNILALTAAALATSMIPVQYATALQEHNAPLPNAAPGPAKHRKFPQPPKTLGRKK